MEDYKEDYEYDTPDSQYFAEKRANRQSVIDQMAKRQLAQRAIVKIYARSQSPINLERIMPFKVSFFLFIKLVFNASL